MLRIALRNLIRARTRSILTLVGVAGSIALFVSLTTISYDLKKQLNQTIAQTNIDIIVQEKGASTLVSSRVSDQVLLQLQQLPGVHSVSSVTIGSIKVPGLLYLMIFGLDSADSFLSTAQMFGAGMIEGSIPRPGKKEVVLGRLAAERLKLKVDDTLMVGGKEPYLITGIYWLGQGILDGGAVIDISTSQILLKRQGLVNLGLVQAIDKKHTVSLMNEIQGKFPDLSAMPASSLRGQIRALSMIDSFIVAVSVTSLLLSGILILNTLLMAISERTREIGILAAVGWTRAMIMRLIIAEALLLGILGGALGYGLSFPALNLLTLIPSMGPGWIPAAPAPELLFAAVGLSGLVAVASALYPALYATRMQPAAALRFE